jgi:hypothetical protein
MFVVSDTRLTNLIAPITLPLFTRHRGSILVSAREPSQLTVTYIVDNPASVR